MNIISVQNLKKQSLQDGEKDKEMGENGEGTLKPEAMSEETSKPEEVSPMEVVPPET